MDSAIIGKNWITSRGYEATQARSTNWLSLAGVTAAYPATSTAILYGGEVANGTLHVLLSYMHG